MSRNIGRSGSTDAVIDSHSAQTHPKSTSGLGISVSFACHVTPRRGNMRRNAICLLVCLQPPLFSLLFSHFFWDVWPFVFALSRRDKKGRTGWLGSADLHSSPSQPCASKKSKMVCSCERTPDKTVRENVAVAASSSRPAETATRWER